MAWIAVDKDGGCKIFYNKPFRKDENWYAYNRPILISLEICNLLIGRELTWNDEPVEIGEIKPVEQLEPKVVEVNDRAEFWKACVLHTDSSQGTFQHISFADQMLKEYDERFGAKSSDFNDYTDANGISVRKDIDSKINNQNENIKQREIVK